MVDVIQGAVCASGSVRGFDGESMLGNDERVIACSTVFMALVAGSFKISKHKAQLDFKASRRPYKLLPPGFNFWNCLFLPAIYSVRQIP
eukprot:1149234-Pelagomonas_calceolata.AAC.13